MEEKDLISLAEEYEELGDEDKKYACLLEAALDKRNGRAAYELADHYYELCQEGTDSEAYDKAAHYYEVAYERGYDIPKYCYIFIADLYENGGLGKEKDINKAILWYKRAARNGITFGYACIGELYFQGKGVAKDYKKAYRYLMKGKDSAGMPLYYLGLMYEEGLGVKKNVKKAKEYYLRVKNEHAEVTGREDFHYERAMEHLAKMETT